MTQPQYPEAVRIYEARSEIQAAAARAEANPQYGHGGGTKIFAPDLNDLIASKTLRPIDGAESVHRFDRGTLESRFEDPEFRAVDPTLPERAINPDTEALRAAGHVGVEKAKDHPVGVAVAASLDRLDEEEATHPDSQGAR